MNDVRGRGNRRAARPGLTRREFLGMAAVTTGATLAGGLTAWGAETEAATKAATPAGSFAPPHSVSAGRFAPAPKPETLPMMANGVIPRSAWTSAGAAKACVPMNGVSLLTFHHDGDPGGFYQDQIWETARYLERIREYHVQNKFEDIGYHYAIDRAGQVWQLRSVAFRGEHVRNGVDENHVVHKWNDHNVGVVVLGNFMIQEPTAAQKERICLFGAQLRKQYNLTIAQVKVHQELVTTECPGVNLRPYMDHVRKMQLV